MSKDRDRHKTEYDLDQLLKESFRMDDKTLLERFQRAQTEIDDSQIPPEPEDGFERLLEKIEPRYTRDSTPEKKFRKIRRLKPIFKVAMVAGVVAIILLATTITVAAKRYYIYKKTVRASIRNEVVIDNDANEEYMGRLEEAYIDIGEKLGIDVLRLEKRPREMIYLETLINGNMATMFFDYEDNVFSVIQKTKDTGNSASVVSDRKIIEKEEVFNEELNMNIEIQKGIRETGEVEYSAEILIGDSYYYLSGAIEREAFITIIQNLYIER